MENWKLAQSLMNIRGSKATDNGVMKKGYSQHLKAKALLCKLPIIDMHDNRWSSPQRNNLSRRHPAQSSRGNMKRITSQASIEADLAHREKRIPKVQPMTKREVANMLRAFEAVREASSSPEGARLGPAQKKGHGRKGGRNDKSRRYKTLDISEDGRDANLDNVYIDTKELDKKGEGDKPNDTMTKQEE